MNIRMADRSISEELTDLALGEFAFDDKTMAQASLVMADSVGVSVLGARMPWSRAVLAAAEDLGGNTDATIVGSAHKTSAYWAAFVNGTFSHANDYDDTYRRGPLHPSAGTWSVLPVAEWQKSTGREAVEAFILYYEVCARLADACFAVPAPGESPAKRGFQAQALCGVFASAVAAARLLHLTHEQCISALGIAGSYPGGLLEFLSDGTDSKRFHFGKASAQGVICALMAKHGFIGPRHIFEGDKGFYHAYVGGWSPSMRTQLFDDFGERWAVFDAIIKRWPGLGGNEPPVEILRDLVEENGLDVDDVASVDVRMREHFIPYAFGVRPYLGCRRRPKNRFEAEMSLPFQIALVMANRRLPQAEDFDLESRKIPYELLALAERVTVIGNGDYDRMPQADGARACEVTLTDRAGRCVTREFIGAGVPHPMSEDEVAAKFVHNAQLMMAATDATTLWKQLSRLHDLSDVAQVLDQLTPPAG